MRGVGVALWYQHPVLDLTQAFPPLRFCGKLSFGLVAGRQWRKLIRLWRSNGGSFYNEEETMGKMANKAAILFLLGIVLVLANDRMVQAADYSGISVRPADFHDNRSISWDITNDGKADSIEFVPDVGTEYGEHTVFTVKINGNDALNMTAGYYAYTYQKITVKGKHFLYIHLSGDSEGGPAYLYQYQKGTLKKVINFQAVPYCYYVGKLTVKKGKLIAKMTSGYGTGLGYMTFQSIYNYEKGKFKLESKEHKILGYPGTWSAVTKNTGQITTRQSITLYKDKLGKKKAMTIPAGVRVKAKKGYFDKKRTSVYIEGGKYKGWYSFKDIMDIYVYDSGSFVYETLFEELDWAG